jgi:hypothetical protein
VQGKGGKIFCMLHHDSYEHCVQEMDFSDALLVGFKINYILYYNIIIIIPSTPLERIKFHFMLKERRALSAMIFLELRKPHPS